MVTMYQLGQLGAFLAAIQAGRTAFPEEALLEVADILEPMIYEAIQELETQKPVEDEQ